MVITRFCALLGAAIVFSPPAFSWDDQILKEPVTLSGLEIPYPEFAIYRLPGSKISISAAHPIRFSATAQSESATAVHDMLVVPEKPGWYHYELTNTVTGEVLKLNVFALIPASRIDANGFLHGYRIGHYPKEWLRGLSIYEPPAGFIEVGMEQRHIRVSPNFTIGQFLSKQEAEFPKFLVLRATLIMRLERILRALNESGRPVDSLHIMSGFRTPYYNQSIGNVAYSRHLWGGATDIFIDDRPKDNYMDDLNGDDVINKKDARWLKEFIDDLSWRGEFANLGGLGVYGSTSGHGPFVHVDVRGWRARW